MTRGEDFVKSMLVSAAWRYGAHFGGYEACLCIMHVIKNREKAGQGTFLHILDNMHKYEAAPPKTTTHPDIWEKRFLKLLTEVDGVYDGTRKDPTNGGLYFGELNDIQSEWFLEKVARTRERCGDMGTLTFFK